MQRSVDDTLADVDAMLFVLDARTPPGAGDRLVARRVMGRDVPVVIALNKVDGLAPSTVAKAIVASDQLGEYEALHPISARRGDGVDALTRTLVSLLPEGPALYGDEMVSGDPVGLRVAELVREQVLQRTRDEVPHSIGVVVDEFERGSRRRAARVSCTLVVETESQKRIVIGRAGSLVRDVGIASRPFIEDLLGTHVMLDLRVRVRPGWRDDPGMLDRIDA